MIGYLGAFFFIREGIKLIPSFIKIVDSFIFMFSYKCNKNIIALPTGPNKF